MTLNEYQQQAMTTCTDTSRNFAYMMLNLIGEVGEFTDKAQFYINAEYSEVYDYMVEASENMLDCGNLAKRIRKRPEDFEPTDLDLLAMPEDDKLALRKEAGDILWQLQGLCTIMGWTLEEVAEENLEKLADRKKRDTIVGEGDER